MRQHMLHESSNGRIKDAADIERNIKTDIEVHIEKEIELLYKDFEKLRIAVSEREKARRQFEKKNDEAKAIFARIKSDVGSLLCYRNLHENIRFYEEALEAYEIVQNDKKNDKA